LSLFKNIFDQKNRILLKKILYWGLGIKRWILVGGIGVLIVSTGIAYTVKNVFNLWIPDILPGIWEGIIVGIFGIIILLFAAWGLLQSIAPILFRIRGVQEITTAIYDRRSREKGPRIVVIGGGTGLSTLLKGIKEYSDNISAIVTVTDEGGSSGRLRRDFSIIPPGDFRKCLVALSSDKLLGDVFEHRFTKGEGIAGHSLGNLFLTALTEITGNFEEALGQSLQVLGIHGKILPSTPSPLQLSATMSDGSQIIGETNIASNANNIKHVSVTPENPQGYIPAIEAINQADLVIIGPGSLFTSILPNLLVPDIREAIHKTNATSLYVSNVANEPGETPDFELADYIKTLAQHTKQNIIDYILVHNKDIQSQKKSLTASLAEAYDAKIIFEDVVDDKNVLIHDPRKLAKAIIDLYYSNTT